MDLNSFYAWSAFGSTLCIVVRLFARYQGWGLVTVTALLTAQLPGLSHDLRDQGAPELLVDRVEHAGDCQGVRLVAR